LRPVECCSEQYRAQVAYLEIYWQKENAEYFEIRSYLVIRLTASLNKFATFGVKMSSERSIEIISQIKCKAKMGKTTKIRSNKQDEK